MRLRSARGPEASESPLGRRRSVLGLGGAALFAGVPSLLLVGNQWFHDPWISTAFESLWQRVPFLADHLAWPPYFLVVILSYLALLLFFGFRRRDPRPWKAGPPDLTRGRAGKEGVGLLGRILVLISGVAL